MHPDLKSILIVDIETVASNNEYQQLHEGLQKEWDKKASYLHTSNELSPEEFYDNRAGIYAEFGKVVTIAVGFYSPLTAEKIGLRVKAFAGDDEKKILSNFKDLLDARFDENVALCAHNGKEFDFPYLCRRMIINGLELPMALDNSGKKPWEVNHIDTMELWKFGDRKNFTSLDLLAALFGIESSKEDIDGSMVNEVYYKDNNLEKIARYCMHDVLVTAQLYLKLNNIHTFSPEDVHMVSPQV